MSEAIKDVIRAQRKPLTAKEICFHLGPGHPKATINQILYKSNEFARIGENPPRWAILTIHNMPPKAKKTTESQKEQKEQKRGRSRTRSGDEEEGPSGDSGDADDEFNDWADEVDDELAAIKATVFENNTLLKQHDLYLKQLLGIPPDEPTEPKKEKKDKKKHAKGKTKNVS